MENPLSSDMIFYVSPQGRTCVEATCAGKALWFGGRRMAGLFGVDERTVNELLKDVYDPSELSLEATIRKILIVQFGGNREEVRINN